MKIIAVINQKGGVGKSTTALALGSGLSLIKGFKVLFVDLDAQGNLSYALNANVSDESKASALEVLSGSADLSDAIQTTNQGKVIASSPFLAGADTILTETGKEYRLKEALDPAKNNFDCVIIDTPPALGVLTVNALAACDGAIIPAGADVFSLQGINQLNGTIRTVKKYCNPTLEIMGILLTRYSGRTIISREIAETAEETAKQLGTKLYNTKIRETTAVKEAQARKESIFEYAPKSTAAIDYLSLIDEILT